MYTAHCIVLQHGSNDTASLITFPIPCAMCTHGNNIQTVTVKRNDRCKAVLKYGQDARTLCTLRHNAVPVLQIVKSISSTYMQVILISAPLGTRKTSLSLVRATHAFGTKM